MLLTPRDVAAHGAAPAFLELLAEDASGPALFRGTRGVFARDRQLNWRFVCPDVWAGPDAPPVVATGAETFYAAGEDGLVYIAVDGDSGVVTGDTIDAPLGAAWTRDAAVLDGDAYVLATAATPGVRSSLWRLEGAVASKLADYPEDWRSLSVHEGTVLVVEADDTDIVIGRLSPEGAVEELVPVPVGRRDFSPELRVVGSEVFIVLRAPLISALVRWDGRESFDTLATSASVIHGPAVIDGEVLFVTDGAWRIADGSAGSPVSDGEGYACVSNAASGEVYVCAGVDMYRVDDSGVPSVPVLRIADIGEPSLPGLDETQRARCITNWEDLRRDSGLGGDADAGEVAGDIDGDAGSGGASAASNCTHSSGVRGQVTPLALLFVLWVSRRRRR